MLVPIEMFTTTTQKMRATERRLQNLSLYEDFDIPGNFRAQQRRRRHDNSKLVFPVAKAKRAEDYKTNYSLNFKSRTNGRPSSPRACSPTRRNNPHPSKNFLTWRIPTRVFDYGESKNANIAFLNSNIDDTYQSFYNDYAGNNGKANEVNPNMLLELTKKYTGTRAAAAHRNERRRKVTVELGIQTEAHPALNLPNLLRKSWSPDHSSLGLDKPRSKNPWNNLSPLFIKPEFQPLFQSWYDTAASGDKSTTTAVADMEENYLHNALETALKPDALEAIEDWLLNADDEERAIAMQFIQTILLHSFEKNNTTMIDESKQKSLIKRPHPTSPTNKLTPAKHHHNHHHMRKGCDVCTKNELESALQKLQTVASMPQDVPGITEHLNPLHPGVIAQKEARKQFVRDGGRLLTRSKRDKSILKGNKGSLFHASQKQGRHFTIHPEWY